MRCLDRFVWRRRVGLAAALGLFGLLSVGLAGASGSDPCDTAWKAPVSGDWSDGSKWTGGVPDASKRACFTEAGSYVVSKTTSAGISAGSVYVGPLASVALSDVSGYGLGLTVADDFTNAGTLDLPHGISITLPPGGTVHNTGTLHLPASGTINANLDNSGIVQLVGGDLQVNGTTSNSDSISVAGGSTLWTAGFSQTAGTVDNAGAFQSSGPVTYNGGTLSGHDVVLYHTSLTLSPDLSGTVAFGCVRSTDTCPLLSNIPHGLSLTINDASGYGVVVSASDGLTVAGTFHLPAGITLTLPPGGTVHITGTLHLPAGGTINANLDNSGTIQLVGGDLQVNGTTTNSGSISVAGGSTLSTVGFSQTAGTTILQGSASNLAGGGLVDIKGGTLGGIGTVSGTVHNGGTVSPGTSPGRLTIAGTYTQLASGHLAIEVTGTAASSFDRLAVTETATLDGTLAITTSGFTPGPADTFAFLTADSRSGTFAAVTGTTISPSRTYAIEYSAVGAGLHVVVLPPTVSLTLPPFTNSRTVTATFATTDLDDAGIVGWCLSESESNPPPDAWKDTKPLSFTLTAGDGTRSIYAWVRDGNGTVSASDEATTAIRRRSSPSSSSGRCEWRFQRRRPCVRSGTR